MAYDESHIGNELYSTEYECPHCGSNETDYDGYCIHCGEHVVQYEGSSASTEKTTPQKLQKKRINTNKKLLVPASLIALVFLLLIFKVGFGDSNKDRDKIGSYSFASFDSFTTSTAAQYSGAHNIYITGTLDATGFLDFSGAPYLVAYIKEDTNKEWICKIGQGGMYSDEQLSNYIGKKVSCFGDFTELKDGKPVLELELYGDHCIQLFNKAGNICDKKSLAASKNYAINWFEKNAPEVVYDDVRKTEGSYRSMGRITDIKVNDKNEISFTLAQKEGEQYYRSYFFDKSDAEYQFNPVSKLQELEDGDGVTLYYVINDKGTVFITGFQKSYVQYSLSEVEDALASEVILEKEYSWLDLGTVNMRMLQTKPDLDYHMVFEAEVNSLEHASAAIGLPYSFFEGLSVDYSVSVSLKDSKEHMFILSHDDSVTILGVEKDGSSGLKAPSWFNPEYLEEESKENYEALWEIITGFSAEAAELLR